MIFTVFCCGTASNSYDFSAHNNPAYYSGELISTLAMNHAGSEFVDWAVVDGPGSGNLQVKDLWVNAPEHSNMMGQAQGLGWEENVKHLLAMITGNAEFKGAQKLGEEQIKILRNAQVPIRPQTEIKKGFLWDTKSETVPRRVTPQLLQEQKARIMRKNKGPITCVNAIGWSRGAVTCNMLANALLANPLTERIEVNIFCVDPVPGTGSFQKHRTNLGRNVKRWMAVYARDDRSYIFMPSVPQLDKGTDCTMMSLPGKHSTLVGGDTPLVGHSAKVVRYLAEEFLTKCGTTINNKLPFNPFEVLQQYDGMLANSAGYKELREKKTGPAISRDDLRYVAVGQNYKSVCINDVDRLRADPPFVNWHHREVFRSTFSRVYNYYFNKGPQVELRSFALRLPATFTSFLKFSKAGV